MMASLLVLAGTVVMFIKIPKGFIPDQDTDQIYAVTEAAQGTSYYQMVDYQKRVAEVFRTNPDVQALMSTVGGTSASTLGGPNYGELVVHLKPRSERKLLVNDIIADLRPQLSNFPGMRVYLQNPPTIRIGGQVTKSLYQFSMQSPDKNELYAGATKLQNEIEKLPEVEDVTSDLAILAPQVNVDHRSRQGRLAASERRRHRERVLRRLRPALGLHHLRGDQRIQGAARTEAAISGRSARALAALLQIVQRPADSARHAGQAASGHRAADHQSLRTAQRRHGFVQSEARRVARETWSPRCRISRSQTLPAGITTDFQGAAKAFQSSLGNLWVLLIVAILVVYIVLGILYESYIHPLTILSGLPSAGFGALITLYLFHMDLNIYAFVGLIMLIGIVEKNAIMQIDFALEAERNQGFTPMKAIYEGCLIRFRPIMMTTMAALLGAVPIALGYGAGGEARQPLGLVVVGGLLFSQLVTLYLTPVFYTYMAAVLEKIQRHKQRAKQALPEPTIA